MLALMQTGGTTKLSIMKSFKIVDPLTLTSISYYFGMFITIRFAYQGLSSYKKSSPFLSAASIAPLLILFYVI